MGGLVFGPVPSRRFGRSLGVDVVPFKTCPYDCIYCQLGRTTNKTIERREWVSLPPLLAELQERLECRPDYITLSGSGESTLYARLGELISAIKDMTSIPVAVLTNGALLGEADVRRELLAADVIAPSLDAPDEALFRYVNRPHQSLHHDDVVAGLRKLRRDYAGQIWLEVFLLAGVTALGHEARRLADLARQVMPDKIHLITATRPTAEAYAQAATAQHMRDLASLFGEGTEVVGDAVHARDWTSLACGETDVLGLLARRPCTAVDVAEGLGMHLDEALKYLGLLVEWGRVRTVRRGAQLFFQVKAGSSSARSRQVRNR